jgi:hypothetical protein
MINRYDEDLQESKLFKNLIAEAAKIDCKNRALTSSYQSGQAQGTAYQKPGNRPEG